MLFSTKTKCFSSLATQAIIRYKFSEKTHRTKPTTIMVHLGGPCPGLQDWIIAVLAKLTNQTDNRPPNKGVVKGKIVISHSAGESGPGKSASVQIYSGNKIDPSTGTGVLSEKTSLKHGNSKKHDGMKTTSYDVKFHVGENFGTPGAFVISNQHKHKFYLQFATLQTSENQIVHFDCRSWVYPVQNTKTERFFFSNKSYLPIETPDALVELRKRELVSLRGNGTGERKEWDRIYDYDCYNDLGNPDKGQELRRPVLGGSATHPYPRRGRTGRPPSNADPSAENRRELIDLDTYVPPDERFSPKKFSEFVANSIGAGVHFLIPEAKSLFHNDSASFESFDEIHSMFTTKRSQAVEGWVSEKLKNMVPETLLRDITDASNKNPMKFPLPQIISENHLAWLNDEEFGRQMLAGTNPAAIRCLESFPPRSKNGSISSITASHVERSLDGLTLDQAMSQWRIFILDHHDYLMPFLNRINTKGVCAYASRTLLFLRSDDTLKPVAIELSLPEPSNVYQLSRVFTPAHEESEAALWKLAKAHVAANDSGHHQLISHWLKTHAVVEPFIIATRRHLSAMHPIHRLLDPHFKDTMHINALSRSMLTNAGGILEKTLFSGEISMELSSALYKEWRFDEQSLPVDLLKRRMALKDSKDPAGVQLLFEDYPYGKDGLQIWVAIKTWVTDFCSLFYSDDNSVVSDTEIQKWWEEVQNEGHPDKRNDIGWYEIDSVSNLIEALTTLIWIASAFHASVHFGQYGYSGYPPNRPTLCRKFIPEEGTLAFGEFLKDPDKYFLKMLPERFEMTLGIAFMEVLSQHTSDEEYLGKRPTMDWTDNEEAVKRFDKFNKNLQHIEKNITERNRNPKLKNRSGPAKIPYTLLYPDTSNLSSRKGLTGMGIPNSISM